MNTENNTIIENTSDIKQKTKAMEASDISSEAVKGVSVGEASTASAKEASMGDPSTASAKEASAEEASTASAKEASAEEVQPAAKPKKKKKTGTEGKDAAKKKKKKLPPKVITLENVGVRFRLAEQKCDNLKEYFVRLVKRKLNYKEFWALRELSLNVRKGDRIGILGLNGAGKSTLLKVIAGVLKPTEGTVEVKGNIVPLLELGAGFDKDYTGGENIFLYGSMLGYSKSFIKEKYNEIVEFSELGDFINVPVKNYSSGMKARLGFSIATVVDPEILILDEVLSVGDAKFRKKSAKKLKNMMKEGVTVLFVSHSGDQVLENCNKAIILEKGHLIASGKAKEVVAQYEEMIGVSKQ